MPESNKGNSTCESNPCESGQVKFENKCLGLFPMCTNGSAVEVLASNLTLKSTECPKKKIGILLVLRGKVVMTFLLVRKKGVNARL